MKQRESKSEEELIPYTTYAKREIPLIHQIWFILAAHHLFQTHQHIQNCVCPWCVDIRSRSRDFELCLLLMDFASPLWYYLIGYHPRSLPLSARLRVFDDLLTATATHDRWLPEFLFQTVEERHLEIQQSGGNVDDNMGGEEVENTFDQLCASLRVTPVAQLRGKIGDATWKARFKGMANKGAEGLPGPFRQSLTEICADLRRTSGNSILIHSPNFVHETGLDRNALILNPSASVSLDACYRFGQLLGIALRSQGVLDLDLASVFYKQLLDIPLVYDDLATYDYTAWRQLQFADHSTDGHPYTESEFEQIFSDLTYVAVLSDGVTRIPLFPHGETTFVKYHQHQRYRDLVLACRFQETRLQMRQIQAGLETIVPKRALLLLTPTELEKRMCGDSVLDLHLLRRHTVYAPKKYNANSPIIQHFWTCLEALTPEERGSFLQFAWARSRLPPVSGRDASWRMKVNILEGSNPSDLPTAETCFFNVNLPAYPSYQILNDKLRMAITHCSSITS